MISLVRPKAMMPVHGEFRMLAAHARLAVESGVAENRIVLAENGSVVELSAAGAKIVGEIESGVTFVDGLGVGDVKDVALRDRLLPAFVRVRDALRDDVLPKGRDSVGLSAVPKTRWKSASLASRRRTPAGKATTNSSAAMRPTSASAPTAVRRRSANAIVSATALSKPFHSSSLSLAATSSTSVWPPRRCRTRTRCRPSPA